MIQKTNFDQSNCWLLDGLQSVFHFALEQKSKCLIQACIFIVEKEFRGISTFSHRTQVKFLLESIRHIIGDNCQEEFIHIMHYLKLLHALCSGVGCEEEYVNSILRIKQSFVLFTLLDNESAANVCKVMNDFFPKNNPLESFNITKGSLKKRFIAVIKRQIYGFRKLVDKLLTDMEFRSYYFYDEWMEEFGTVFHSDMITDIDKYLKKIELCLLAGRKTDEIYRSWLSADQIANPTTYYFLKLLSDHTVDNKKLIDEFKLLQLLKWMFPSLDFGILTMPCTSSLTVPDVFIDIKFLKLSLQAGWTVEEKKPWDYDNFTDCLHRRLNQLEKITQDDRVESNISHDDENDQKQCTHETSNKQRRPFAVLSENLIDHRGHLSTRTKRKRNETENSENTAKRPRTDLPILKAISQKSLVVDLCKKNIFKKPGKFMESDNGDSTIKISIDSPQCRRLLESGSKFFFSNHKDKKTTVFHDLSTQVTNETNCEAVEFSDEENDSDKLNVTEDTMSTELTWISTTRNNKTTPISSRRQKTCRSLYFKSESSDEHVSESEPESTASIQPMLQDCLKMIDQTLVPDLTFHINRYPETRPCTVTLEIISNSDLQVEAGETSYKGCKIMNEDDLKLLENGHTVFKFRNYSPNCSQ